MKNKSGSNHVQLRNRRLLRLSGQLRLGGIARYRAIHEFKNKTPYPELIFSFQQLFKTKNSLIDFHGEAFPHNVDALFSANPPRVIGTVFSEIFWAVGRALQFSQELGQFVGCRHRFETAVICDDAVQAWQILDEVESKFGLSLWLLQNRLSVRALPSSAEIESLGTTADTIEGLVSSNPMLRVLMNYARKRTEGAVLRENLKTELQNQFADSAQLLEYLQTKLFDNSNSGATNIASVLFYDAQSSLIDHYDALVMALQAIAADHRLPENFHPHLGRPLEEIYATTGDVRLLGILRYLGKPTLVIPDSWQSDSRNEIIEAYSSANYEFVCDKALIYSENHPLDISVRVLEIKASIKANRSLTKDGSLWSQIATNLTAILALSEEFYSAAYSIFSVADKFYGHSWMRYLRLAVMYEIRAESQTFPPPWIRDVYVLDPCVSPFSAIAANGAAKTEIIESEELREIYPSTFQALDSILFGKYHEGINHERSNRYLARYLLNMGEFSSAADLFIESMGMLDGAERLRCAGGAAIALAELGKLKESVDLAITAYLETRVAPTLLPLKKIVDHLKDPADWPISVNLCILFDLYGTYSNEDTLSPLRYAFELFQTQQGIDSPDELASMEDALGQRNIIYYLDKVWRPEVMRQTILFDGAQAIEDERIKVCGTLARIDSNNARKYLDEMATRVKQSEIAKATSLVEKSIVYVDIEAIKRSLKARLGNSYVQYKNSALQIEKTIDPIVEQISEVLAASPTLSIATLLSHFHIVGHKEKMTQADRQFAGIFSEVTNEFLRGDHGLNAYLSTRVRHGKLINALRKAVMDEAIITSKTAENVYLENKFWRSKALAAELQWDPISQALQEFSNDFDNILIYIRDELIQIRVIHELYDTGENKNGLFIYSSSPLERLLVQGYDKAFTDLDELVGKCIDTLWEKTDLNLSTVREKLDHNIREKLSYAFDQLTTKLATTEFGELINAIARSRTSTQSSLDTVISWFRRSEVFDRADFAVDLPPRIAFNVVRQTMSFSANWKGPRLINSGADELLPGRALDGLTDIFYVLMENSIKYSATLSIDVEVKTSFQSGEYRCAFLSRAAKPSEQDLSRIETLRESLLTPESRRLAQIEGKSGFRKIWIALDNPMYREPKLTFGFKEDGWFEVNIFFKVKYENTLH